MSANPIEISGREFTENSKKSEEPGPTKQEIPLHQLWLTNSRSKTNFSFQLMVSYVWYSMEKLAGDLLLVLKLVKVSILPMPFIQFV